ncbi:hypothetical protein M3Y97_01051600 [Aphelenchoides bicaudatus]|nr:hypothetical protein M3Y97_01051600 [Aphelenchoides bicaudatus]
MMEERLLKQKLDIRVVDDDGNGFLLERMPFNVAEVGDCAKQSTFSLSHSFDNYFNDFIKYALIEQDEKVVTLTQHKDNLNTGFLSFGGTRPGLCSIEWHTFPETLIDFDSAWRFDLDSISIGSFKVKQPGRAKFNINNKYFKMSSLVYDRVVKELGIIKNHGKCTNSKNITFNLNGFDLHLNSKHYMEERKHNNKNCNFLGVRGDDNDDFELPSSLLGDYCLMFDYERNEIGISERLYD